MYSISAFGSMIADRVRMVAYENALRKAVKPGSVVLDIGSGTGIFTFLACCYGARHVYAVEPDDAIQVAREVARVNGIMDRITFIQELSTQVKLPELVDVIVSDLRGILPLFQNHINAVIDARSRFLAPGGALIPERDVLYCGLVEAPELYKNYIGNYGKDVYPFDFAPARKLAANSWGKGLVKHKQLLARPAALGILDYQTIQSPDFSGEVQMTARKDGLAHGLSLWFDTTLLPGIGFSSGPGSPSTIYGMAFFPLLEQVSVEKGDKFKVSINADLVGGEYIWRWKTKIFEAGSNSIKAEFHQSTFQGVPLSAETLHRQAADYVPNLTEDGQVDLFILTQMAERIPLGEIAAQLVVRFPGSITDRKDAMARVGTLSKKYIKLNDLKCW